MGCPFLTRKRRGGDPHNGTCTTGFSGCGVEERERCGRETWSEPTRQLSAVLKRRPRTRGCCRINPAVTVDATGSFYFCFGVWVSAEVNPFYSSHTHSVSFSKPEMKTTYCTLTVSFHVRLKWMKFKVKVSEFFIHNP